MKFAIIHPIPKTQSPKYVSDFRLISILPLCSKVLENIIVQHVRPYTDAKMLANQYGFRPKCSTVDALMYFNQYVCSQLDIFPTVCGVFVDVSKAFDTVNHDLLLSTLRDHYSIPGYLLAIIRLFLAGRQAYVRCNGAMSNIFDVNAGIPQGSVLGPLLFNAFINSVNCLILSAGAKNLIICR